MIFDEKQKQKEFKIHRPPLHKTDACPEHGEFLSLCYYENVWSGCPQCEKRVADEKERSKREKEDAQKIAYLLHHSGISLRFANKTFNDFKVENPQQSAALQVVKKYAEDWKNNAKAGKSLVLLGSVGTGKTLLASALADFVIKTHKARVKYISTLNALRAIKETWSVKEARERVELEKLTTPDLLILDEVGVQFGTDAERLILFEIINARYENLRPTVLISNLDATALTGSIGDRSMDRLLETGQVVRFQWNSYRKSGGAR